MEVQKIYRDASNGEGKLMTRVWKPDGNVRALVQIAHGMGEHCGRYSEFAAALTEQGYAVYANDHAGHGESTLGHPGTFSLKEGGFEYVIRDMYTLTQRMREEYPERKLMLFGHSMGSLLSALYATRFGESIDALALCGMPAYNPMTGFGIKYSRLVMKLFGRKKTSRLLAAANRSAFNKGIENRQSDHDWLTHDVNKLMEAAHDPYLKINFSASAYNEMLSALVELNSDEWAKKVPLFPMLIVAGKQDPCGDFGKAPEIYRERLEKTGHSVGFRLFENDRHEILNELDRAQVMDYIIGWMNGQAG